jgi:signal transduction histidine kinase
LYLIHNHSYVVSWGASSLLVSGSILFVFTSALAFGGKNFQPFLLTYSFMLLLTLLSQLAFLSIYIKKENRGMDWAKMRTKAPAIVDLVEHRTHLFRTLTIALMAFELLALSLAFFLSFSCCRIEDQNYIVEYESVDLEEQQDLLQRSRRRENYERAKKRRRARMKELKKLREKFEQ